MRSYPSPIIPLLSCAALPFMLMSAPICAQGPKLLKHINQEVPVGSYPEPARLEGIRDSAAVAKVQGKWLFKVRTKDHGNELMVTDGTPKGTQILDLVAGPSGTYPSGFCPTGDGKQCFFVSGQFAPQGRELWVTDGTLAGSHIVKDIVPGNNGSEPEFLAAIGSSRVVFSAEENTNGRELWISDGTAAGTKILAQITNPIRNSLRPEYMSSSSDRSKVYFSAISPASGREELYVTDGTTTGTYLVKKLDATWGSVPREFMPLGSSGMLFVGFQTATGRELWKTDGTATGTTLVRDFAAGPNDGNVDTYFKLNGRYLVLAETGFAGREFFTTDGSPAGTTMVKDLTPGVASTSPALMQRDADGKHAYFHHNSTIYVTDATALGTRQYLPFTFSRPLPVEVCSHGKYIFFPADLLPPTRGTDLYVSDGTVKGTRSLGELRPGYPSWPTHLLSLGASKVFFQADGGQAGNEPWFYDQVQDRFDIAPLERSKSYNSSSGDIAFLTPLANTTLFRADDGLHGRELWGTDGSAAGTRMLLDLWPGKLGSDPSRFYRFGNKALFVANTFGVGKELWVSDGTSKGTQLLADIDVGPESGDPLGFTRIGNRVWFAADDGKNGQELWVTDGTRAGTRMFADLVAGAGSSSPRSFVGRPGRMFFSAYLANGQDRELWISDGSIQGTRPVKDLYPGSTSSFPWSLTWMPKTDSILFTAKGNQGLHHQLAVSDGTRQGTSFLFSDYRIPVGASPRLSRYEPRLGRVLFTADGIGIGTEPYWTDGTKEGTRLLRDIWPGTTSGTTSFFYAIGDSAFFTAGDSQSGRELWRVGHGHDDVSQVWEYMPGSQTGCYSILGKVGNHRLLLIARTPASGTEFHLYDADTKKDVVLDFAPGMADSGATIAKIWRGQLLMPLSLGRMNGALYSWPLGAISQTWGPVQSANWLDAQDPVVGSKVRIVAGSPRKGVAHLILLGSFHPGQLVLSRYLSYVDLLKPTISLGLGAGREFPLSVPIPNHSSLIGQQFALQAWSFDPLNFSATLELSRGEIWTMGK